MSAPPHIDIVGLGPGDPDLRTIGVDRLLAAAAVIVLRTAHHPGIADLVGDARVVTCDDLYDTFPTFADVYAAIATRACDTALAAQGAIVYAVPGHPGFGERAVLLVLEQAPRRGISVRVHAAVSAFDAMASALGRDFMAEQVQLIDATDLTLILDREPFAGGALGINPSRPVLVSQIHDAATASATKLVLSQLFPDNHQVSVVHAAGVPGQERVETLPLFALDRRPSDFLTSAYVPGLAALDATRSPYTLQHIVARLRAPGGCPWDRAQTHATLRDAIIEEAYETVDTIDDGDAGHLTEELGDLILIAAMHAQIAAETGEFTLEDVYQYVSEKLVRRHPHVFGDVAAETPEAVVTTWDAVKAAEREARGQPAKAVNPFEKLPRSMPALHRARVLYGPRKGGDQLSPSLEDAAQVGAQLLTIAREAAARGIDPEAALATALRREFAHTTASDEASTRE